MNSGLVSIIVPCYNVEALLPNLINSLLHQSYKNLEVIFVNDGSSDNTWNTINNYVPPLKAEGYKVTAVNQENFGVASAIDCGLKLFDGEFLTWPDSDDWLTPNSILERVKVFREHPSIGLVRCNAEKIEMETGQSIGFCHARSDDTYVHTNMFSDLVHVRTYFAPVCYMVRSSFFLKVNPDRSIFVTRGATQNLQMLLPISYAYGSIQMETPLAFYLVRKGSLCRSANSPEALFKWDSLMWEITRQTLMRMKNIDQSFISEIYCYFIRNKLLPSAFKARLEEESWRLLRQSGFAWPRTAVCKSMIFIRCSKADNLLDGLSLRYWSKILYRLFWMLIRG